MSYCQNTWNNFVRYVSTFKPYVQHKDKLISFFGNSRKPQSGFRSRALCWYNPVSNRLRFNCGYRMCINVYLSCDHGCAYCYVNGYSGGVGTGRHRAGFIEMLKRDMEDFRELGMPPGPVHMSNSTDPFQERLESQYRDTLRALRILQENKDLFSEITIVTKNPSFLLGRDTGYLDLVKNVKEKLNIEITIPFFRDNYSAFELLTPHPRDRLDALRNLAELGFTVRLRLDPLFPRDSGVQTEEDIVNILRRSEGVQCVISKPLRLVAPRRGVSNSFFDEMRSYYQGGKGNGVEWHSGRYVYSAEKSSKEMRFLSKECERRHIPFFHCKETVLVDQDGIPIIKRRLGHQ